MQITYASHHSWYKYSLENSLEHYGKNDQKRLRKSLDQAATQGVTYEFKPADEAFLTWFLPMYERIIGSKKNPHIYDIASLLKEPKEQSFGYLTLTVRDHGQIVGGCIFNDFGWYYSIAYRVYEHDWPQAELPASPSFLGELQLDMFTKEQGRKMLSHGKDRNPYGLNSAIGLSIFKLAVGCKPRTSLTHEVKQLETDDVTEDCLILHYPKEGRIITEATLLCTTETESRYQQLKAYADRLTIHTVIRPTT
jgi:hypothetical protein